MDKILVAEIEESGPMDFVATRFCGYQGVRRAPSELRIGAGGKDFEFLYALKTVWDHGAATSIFFVVDAIHQHVKVAPAAAADGNDVRRSAVLGGPLIHLPRAWQHRHERSH